MTSDGKMIVALSKKLAVYDVKIQYLIGETELSASPKVLTLSGNNRRAFLTNPDVNSASVADITPEDNQSLFKRARNLTKLNG